MCITHTYIFCGILVEYRLHFAVEYVSNDAKMY